MSYFPQVELPLVKEKESLHCISVYGHMGYWFGTCEHRGVPAGLRVWASHYLGRTEVDHARSVI